MHYSGECMGLGNIWKLSVLYTQFCYEPKTAKKKKNIDKFQILSFMGIHLESITLQYYFKIYAGLGWKFGACINLRTWGRK